jgi:AraC-like DNA-binding protein
MSKLHLYHISFFDSLLKGLHANGVAVDKLAQHSYIKHFDLSNPNTHLPLEVAYELFNEVKSTQGIDCISGEFYGGFQVEDLSEYGQFLSSCPDLYSILSNAIKYDYLIQTSGELKLQTDGALTRFSMRHLDAPSEGRQISERINLAMIIKAFQLVLGPEWAPVELQVPTMEGYWVEKLLPFSNFKIKTNDAEIAVCFKTEELAAKNSYYSDKPTIEHKDKLSIEAITAMVINSMVGSYLPTIEEFSQYFGYSKRTIIRAMNNAGTSYKEILEKHQFISALELMGDYNLSIDEISTKLGYAHPSNFIKSFKRWTSATPNAYRQQALLQVNGQEANVTN